jgi:DNA-binding NtrC family response regulator/tetratricopeptide (TPR) repeat protein
MTQAHVLPPGQPTERLVGESAAIRALYEQVRHLATFDTLGNPEVPTLLLHGETGTGKGLVARLSHASGPRRHGPFIEVNCAAIPEHLLEAELFGFEAGAFTDAKRAKPGLLDAASGGTLLLDEIDALPLPLQGKFLNAIEEKRIRRVGALRGHAVDVKLIAATQADLNARIAAGSFRADLYYRLAVMVLEMPPLRARGEDVIVLAEHFLQRYAQAHGLVAKRLSAAAVTWLQGYDWPGNVRELSHLMERVTLLSPEAILAAETLEHLCLPRPQPHVPAEPESRNAGEPMDEPARIAQALGWAEGNVMRAARLLGLSRSALRHRLRRYGIERPHKALVPHGTLTWEPTPPPDVPSRKVDGAAAPQDAARSRLAREAAPAPSPGWEQKPVAVLAIELTWPETTTLEAQRYEPWTAMVRWEQAIVEKVQGFGGVLLQRSPSLLTAAFGIPRTIDQLPQRAVQVALALRHQLAQARTTEGRESCPVARLAIHLGQMLVELQADAPAPRGLAVGETLALPVRLLGLAAVGDVLVSPQVGRQVEGWFALELCEVALAGARPHRVSAYRVVGLDPQRFSLAGLGMRVHHQFIGRERELATLHELWARAERGRGQVVGIVGEPGVGKSRLLYEFRHQVEAQVVRAPRGQGVLFLDGRGLAYGSLVPYFPLLDLLKAYFQINDRDVGTQLGDKITSKLGALDKALSATLPALLGLFEVPVADPQWQALEPPQRRQRTLDALKHLLLRESQVQPLLLVIEDLHWIDTETQALLDRLVESLPSARALLLCSYRPEYQHGWGSRTYYTQLRIDPLPPERAGALLDALLGADASLQPLKALLIERTGGNPFFLEEIVQILVETEVLVGKRGAYRVHRRLPTIRVPTTVEAVLAARIDRLPPVAKQLLQTAAVIGTEVPFALLQAIATLPEAELHRGLEHLQVAEFLYETRLFPERVFTFKHALTHEVAYNSLLQERRRVLHGRILETLETLYAERLAEQVDRLAHHAVHGAVWDKALTYSRQAGARAASRSAYREAVGYFEQALAAPTQLPENRDRLEQAIDLRFDLRTVLFTLGEQGRIMAHLHDAETLAEALADQSRLGRVSVYMSAHFQSTGDQERAIVYGKRALDMAEALGDFALQVVSHLYLGASYLLLGDYPRADTPFKWNIQFLAGERLYERCGMAGVPAVMSRSWLLWSLAEQGEFAQGIALGEEGIRIAEAVGQAFSRIHIAHGVGRLYLRQGDFTKAIHILEGGLQLCQVGDVPLLFPTICSHLGYAYALSGRLAEAIPLLEQALEQATARELMRERVLRLVWLGEAYLLASRFDEATEFAAQALELSRGYKERGHEAWTLRLLGEIARRYQSPDLDQTITYYRQALTLAGELGMRPLQAHCHLGLGTLYAGCNQRQQAHVALSAAIALYRAMDMTFWLPQAEAVLADVA